MLMATSQQPQLGNSQRQKSVQSSRAASPIQKYPTPSRIVQNGSAFGDLPDRNFVSNGNLSNGYPSNGYQSNGNPSSGNPRSPLASNKVSNRENAKSPTFNNSPTMLRGMKPATGINTPDLDQVLIYVRKSVT